MKNVVRKTERLDTITMLIRSMERFDDEYRGCNPEGFKLLYGSLMLEKTHIEADIKKATNDNNNINVPTVACKRTTCSSI